MFYFNVVEEVLVIRTGRMDSMFPNKISGLITGFNLDILDLTATFRGIQSCFLTHEIE